MRGRVVTVELRLELMNAHKKAVIAGCMKLTRAVASVVSQTAYFARDKVKLRPGTHRSQHLKVANREGEDPELFLRHV
jgi:hypothetical protein